MLLHILCTKVFGIKLIGYIHCHEEHLPSNNYINCHEECLQSNSYIYAFLFQLTFLIETFTTVYLTLPKVVNLTW